MDLVEVLGALVRQAHVLRKTVESAVRVTKLLVWRASVLQAERITTRQAQLIMESWCLVGQGLNNQRSLGWGRRRGHQGQNGQPRAHVISVATRTAQ